MPIKKAKEESCTCEQCKSDIAALKKEVAGLKSQLSKVKASKGGGNDPRVDKLIEFLKQSARRKRLMEDFGI